MRSVAAACAAMPASLTQTKNEPGASASSASSAVQSGAVEPGTADAEPGADDDAPSVEHVPVKKKGSRKR